MVCQHFVGAECYVFDQCFYYFLFEGDKLLSGEFEKSHYCQYVFINLALRDTTFSVVATGYLTFKKYSWILVLDVENLGVKEDLALSSMRLMNGGI